jgi:hypothetical protein
VCVWGGGGAVEEQEWFGGWGGGVGGGAVCGEESKREVQAKSMQYRHAWGTNMQARWLKRCMACAHL